MGVESGDSRSRPLKRVGRHEPASAAKRRLVLFPPAANSKASLSDVVLATVSSRTLSHARERRKEEHRTRRRNGSHAEGGLRTVQCSLTATTEQKEGEGCEGEDASHGKKEPADRGRGLRLRQTYRHDDPFVEALDRESAARAWASTARRQPTAKPRLDFLACYGKARRYSNAGVKRAVRCQRTCGIPPQHILRPRQKRSEADSRPTNELKTSEETCSRTTDHASESRWRSFVEKKKTSTFSPGRARRWVRVPPPAPGGPTESESWNSAM